MLPSTESVTQDMMISRRYNVKKIINKHVLLRRFEQATTKRRYFIFIGHIGTGIYTLLYVGTQTMVTIPGSK